MIEKLKVKRFEIDFDDDYEPSLYFFKKLGEKYLFFYEGMEEIYLSDSINEFIEHEERYIGKRARYCSISE